MNPPAEQLIRDYLNRLSVAARGALGHKNLQALLDQTRARIEVECGGLRDASQERVRQVLDHLGDPAVLAEAERVRIAARESPAARHEAAEPEAAELEAAEREVPEREVPEREVAPCLEADLASGASLVDWSIPAGVAGSPTAASSAGMAGSADAASPAPARTGLRLILPWIRPAAPAQSSSDALVPVPGSDVTSTAADGDPGLGAGRQPAFIPRQPTRPESYREEPPGGNEPEPGTQAGTIELSLDPALLDDGQSGVVARIGETSVAAADLLSRLVRRLAWIGQQYKFEALAVLLLGVGGAVFPPLWLLGAVVALPSRTWDVRDKWLGIVLPVLTVLVGAALIIVFGGARSTLGSYIFEAWVGAGRLFRLLAAVSAGYLLCRLHLGRRQPKLPPWNIPHKLDI